MSRARGDEYRLSVAGCVLCRPWSCTFAWETEITFGVPLVYSSKMLVMVRLQTRHESSAISSFAVILIHT